MSPETPDGGFDMDDGRKAYSSVCTFCLFSKCYPVGTCRAFPQGIPDDIWEGRNPHTEAAAGDRGMRFHDLRNGKTAWDPSLSEEERRAIEDDPDHWRWIQVQFDPSSPTISEALSRRMDGECPSSNV